MRFNLGQSGQCPARSSGAVTGPPFNQLPRITFAMDFDPVDTWQWQQNAPVLGCDSLIDQNRSIGGDPVGHRCYERASWFTRGIRGGKPVIEFRLCDRCFAALVKAQWDFDHAGTQIIIGPIMLDAPAVG